MFEQLQRGDILLSFHKGNLISEAIAKTTNSPWSHALLFIGDGKIYESTGQGVHVGDLSKYEDTKIYTVGAYRLKSTTPEQLDLFVACAEKRIGKRYGFFQVTYLWFLYLFGLAEDKFWQRDVDSGEDCVETIARAAQAAGIALIDKNPSMIIPDDYARCDKLERIL